MEMAPEQKKALEEQKKNCPFCKIVKGEIDSKKVYEDDLILIILDINPAAKGHMLILPKEHYPIMPLIPPETFKRLFEITKSACKISNDGMLSLGNTVFIANGPAAGQQSQHFMLHVIPRDKHDGLAVLEIPSKELPKEDTDKVIGDLSNNFTVMMQNHYKRMGKKFPGKEVTKKVSDDQEMALIEQNPPLKELILSEPEQFKEMVPKHNQLKPIFENKDLDAIITKVFEKAGKKYVPKKPEPKKEEPKKEEVKQEEKKLEEELSPEEASKEPEEPEKTEEEKQVDEEVKEEEEALKKEAEKGSEPKEPEPEKKPEPKKEKANLDDIANLFK